MINQFLINAFAFHFIDDRLLKMASKRMMRMLNRQTLEASVYLQLKIYSNVSLEKIIPFEGVVTLI